MFTFIRNLVEANKKTLKNNTGATMIEYALVVGAVVAVAVTFFKSDQTGVVDNAIAQKLSNVAAKITSN